MNCDYHDRQRRCPESPSIEILIDGKPVKLCDRHQRPEYHPADIRAKLPAKLAAGTGIQMTPVKHPADGTWSPPLVNDTGETP
jgi:hypothetical protein